MIKTEDTTKRFTRYSIFGLMVFLSLYYIPKRVMSLDDILIISILISLVYGLLDIKYAC